MSIGIGTADERKGAVKAYAVNVHAKAHSSTSCSFCWFVVALYPTLNGMTDRDGATYRAHLEKAHGLGKEIQP